MKRVLTMLAVLVLVAQAPETPRDVPVRPERPHPIVAGSDKDRVVGKVLHIDRAAGLVKLDSDEGVVVMQAPSMTLNAIRVGDTVSVPRSAGEAPSASPRTRSRN